MAIIKKVHDQGETLSATFRIRTSEHPFLDRTAHNMHERNYEGDDDDALDSKILQIGAILRHFWLLQNFVDSTTVTAAGAGWS